MNPKEIVGLVKAYNDVYAQHELDEATAMAKRGHDETAIRQQTAKSTGGGESADRATKLADKQTYGQRGVDPKARENLARKQRTDFRKTTSSSSGLRGYGHQSNDPAVKAKQAARGAQRGVLTPNEKKTLNREQVDLYDIILSHLLDEGYADTEESATAIMVNMSEDWKENIMERDAERGEDDPAVRAHNKSLKGKDGKPLYPSGRAGYSRKRPFDPRYGSPQR